MNTKIGIVTFHRANNYGAVLQNLALVHMLQHMCPGAEVKTIDYRCPRLEQPYEKKPFDVETHNIARRIYNCIRAKMANPGYLRLKSEFDSFRKRYLNMTDAYSEESLLNKDLNFDLYITGSDQVWNKKIVGEEDKVFSLAFAKGKRAISYAASAGSVELLSDATMNAISQLSAISVREQDLQSVLSRSLNQQVQLVVDPVFLLTRKTWEDFLPKERLIKEKYIFTYSVSEKTSEVIQIAKKIAASKKCKIVHLDLSLKYGLRGKNMYGAAPLEFVQLIRDAEQMVVSSFHAVAFSIIFGKKFIVVPTEKTSSRIEHLLELAGLKGCIVSSYKEFISNRMVSQYTDCVVLENERKRSLDYLKTQIETL